MPEFLQNIIEYIINNPKDFVNICFWTITGILAIGAYSNAKKTLFNPIRSEMVKYQMKVITEFIDNHTSKGHNFDNAIDYSNLIKLNYDTDYLIWKLANEYESQNDQLDDIDKGRVLFCNQNLGGFFEVTIKEKQITLELFYGDFDTAVQYVKTEFIRDKELRNTELTLQRFYLTHRFCAFYADLLSLKSNPFIPRDIKNSIDRILSNIYENIGILHELLSVHIFKQTDARYQLISSQFLERKIDQQTDLDNLRKIISIYFKVNF